MPHGLDANKTCSYKIRQSFFFEDAEDGDGMIAQFPKFASSQAYREAVIANSTAMNRAHDFNNTPPGSAAQPDRVLRKVNFPSFVNATRFDPKLGSFRTWGREGGTGFGHRMEEIGRDGSYLL